MTIEQIKQIIKEKTQQFHLNSEIVERKSTTSESWYFTIFSGDKKTSLEFRVSDHSTKSNISTLRTDLVTTRKATEAYISNRCRDLSDRHIKMLLGIRVKK